VKNTDEKSCGLGVCWTNHRQKILPCWVISRHVF